MDKIVWMISAYAQKRNGFNHTIVHYPLSRQATSAAEAKGLGLEWLAENYPASEGWGNYSPTVSPVFSEDLERLKAKGEATS